MAQNDSMNRSFRSILEEKLDKSSVFDETPRPASSENRTPPTSFSSESLWEKLSQLGLGQMNKAVKTRGKAPYSHAKSSEPIKPQVNWKPVGLSAEVTKAYEFFHRNGAMITDKSSRTELKRAFRQLAKTLHPDRHTQTPELIQRQYAQLFNELKVHYATLTR